MALTKFREAGVGLRPPDDPFFATGNAVCGAYKRYGVVDINEEQLCHQVLKSFPCHAPNCTQEFSTTAEYELHYNSRHRFVCSECKKCLPSPHLLDLHVSETHDSFFQVRVERKETNMYRCFVEDCTVKSSDPAARRSHCIEVHNFPHDFRFDQSAKKSKTKSQSAKKKDKANKQEDSAKAAMDTNTTDPVSKTVPPKTFSFGQNKTKMFSSETAWHARGKQTTADREQKNDDVKMDELMETLPE